ncbi:DUF5641 domain-containing protein [Trichonephila clavipes]|nr:DUF5641 domain-containing protein [Trichonephila clavipes]
MTNLRNLVDTSDEVLRGLKTLGTEATNRDSCLIQIVIQKLDTETKRLLSVKTAQKDFSTLKEFLEFLNHTIPPLSPHFGRLWEAGVKSVKFHLKRVMGSTNLTFEEFYTLLTQIEAVLNSRLLVRLAHNDIDSLSVLTASHFLVGEEIKGPPETVEESKLALKGRWDTVQKSNIVFWKIWQIA